MRFNSFQTRVSISGYVKRYPLLIAYILPIFTVTLEARGKGSKQFIHSYSRSRQKILNPSRKAITCLAFSVDGVTLVSGSEDGTLRVWDTKSQHVTRILKHAKGSVNNVLIIRQPRYRHSFPPALVNAQASLLRKHFHLSLPPPLSKYIDSADGEVETKAVNLLQLSWQVPQESKYCTSNVMTEQIKELQQQNSSGAAEMELERLWLECKRSAQMVQQWNKIFL